MKLTRCFSALLLAAPWAAEAQFAPASVLLTDDAPDPFTAVDIDGDGDLDLVRLLDGFGLIAYTNFDGLGSFAFGGIILSSDQDIEDWALGDIDGDGLPDAAAVLDDDNLVHAAFNLGNGAFSAPVPVINAGESIVAVDLAELNGDGLLDLVYSIDMDGEPSQLLWCANTGGTFAEPVSVGGPIHAPIGPFIRCGDLDHAGGNDLLVMDGLGTVMVLRNVNGDGSAWTKDDVFDASATPLLAPQLIDADGDGDLDLAEAAFPAVRWIENSLTEGGNWDPWALQQLEPFISAGPGAFGRLGCGTGAGVVVFPLNPGAAVRYSHWVPAPQAFAFANAMDLPRGQVPLLADVNGDGRDDLILHVEGERLLFINQLTPATLQITLPELPDLCKYGQPFPLPDAAPAGGQWMGPSVFNGELLRSNLLGDGVQALSHVVYEPQGCPAGAAAEILVVDQPIISPVITGVLCMGDSPIQFTSTPPATTWIGTDANGVLPSVPYQQGVVVAIYEDATGEVCASESEPYIVWPSMPAQINPAGPFCVNSGQQLITAAVGPGVDYSWEGSISGYNSAGASFQPASLGAGLHPVVLIVEPNQPGYCEGFDTLWVSVSDAFPEVSVQAIGAHCSSSAPIDLLPLGAPAGGTWAGPAVAQGSFSPALAGAGSFLCTYLVSSPEGCTSAGVLQIDIVGEAQVGTDSDDLVFCTSEDAAHFTGFPAGGAWTAPIQADGTLDPATTPPGDYPVIYTWTGADGCSVVNATSTLYVLVTTEPVIDPLGVVCVEDGPLEVTGAPAGLWGGSVTGSGPSVLLDPAALGPGIWPISLTATAPDQCPGTTTMEVLVEICTETADPGGAAPSVWPNPFADQLWLQAGQEGLTGAELRDATGRLVSALGPTAPGHRQALPVANTPAGPYILRWTAVSGRSGIERLVRW